ncbi:hypothetical protein PR202_gb07874 [Eleusine coracana subsp. coracana]|uniref:Protein TIFY n=1 Tax=Eleusine coracana subsp. coracana TaxID=191504 RepID=A0AAV5EDC1_ELECO|nr:hypothetical protein QOZ80_2BG0178290 [Eleusine coracana subsp. coracana]GJN20490.1 hypothetical protein PR202_gb07874 [Eleusine coracana subsp. coracana]
MAATMTTGGIKSRARFTAACGVLSQYVKQAAAMEAESRPVATPVALPLMPGADVSTATTQEEQEPASSASQVQMTIIYGGQVVVLDDVHTDRAAELFRLAAAAAAKEAPRHGQAVIPANDLLPMAKKASLQRFMEKRRCRVAARATPYSRPAGNDACPDDDRIMLKL